MRVDHPLPRLDARGNGAADHAAGRGSAGDARRASRRSAPARSPTRRRFDDRSSTGTATSTPPRSTSAPSSIRSAPQLPAGADRILMFSFSAADQPVVVVRISADQDLTDQYETLEKYLQAADRAHRGRGARRAAGRAAARGAHPDRPGRGSPLTASTCSSCATLLETSNFSVSAGEITENNSRFSVRPIGEFRTLDDIRNLLVAPGVRLADIAAGRAGRAGAADRPPHGRPARRRHRRVQDDAGQRRRRRRPRASRRSTKRADAAATAGHPDPRHRQPGRQHPRFAAANCAMPA